MKESNMGSAPNCDKAVHRLLQILIADDSMFARSIVKRGINALSGQCYFELNIASDGIEALEILRKKPIDLAFVDINMPGMGGPDLIAAIKDTVSKDCLTVAMSTELDCSSEAILKEFNAYHFMKKPFGGNDIADVFHAFLIMIQTYSILVVDNSATMRTLSREILERSRFSFDISEADNAQAAIRQLIAIKPKFVLTDFHMPGGDGVQLAGIIHGVSEKIGIYLMSNSPSVYIERSAAFVGATGFLKKPFTPQDIDSLMHDYLGLDAPRFGTTRSMFSFMDQDMSTEEAYI